MRAMRAVWLTMRDEDPPDRGLADLLAAARGKAEAMEPRPSAWQRLLAAMRRPPALALATATVLIAGAALIGRRVASEAPAGAPTSVQISAPTAAGTPAGSSGTAAAGAPAGSRQDALDRAAGSGAGAAPAGGEPSPAEATAARDGEQAARDGGAPAAPASVPEPTAPRATRPPPSDSTRAEATTAMRPPKPVKTPRAGAGDDLGAIGREPTAPSGAQSAGHAEGFASPPRPAPPAAPHDDRAGTADASLTAAPTAPRPPSTGAASHAHGREPSPGASGGESPPPRPAATTPDAPRPEPRAPASSDAEAHDGRTARAPAPPGDLYRQCETAARQGDCAAVRRLVSQITRTDRGYRARIARDSAVGKCLAE